MRESLLLAGDIGGTKTNLAIFSSEAGPRSPLQEATYPSAKYPSLEAMAGEFLSQVDAKVNRASFGVAGPVVGGRVTTTNLPWMIDELTLQKALNLSSARLLNDLVAVAHAVPFLQPVDLETLSEGQSAPGGAMAVIAPGTGLGEAYLTWDGSRYRAYASEGGHADFAPNNSYEAELFHYLQDRLGHVSYERVCSGRGIPHIYNHLRDSGHVEEPVWLRKQLATADDPTPIIVNAALSEQNPPQICVETVNVFITILGAEAGNLALKVLATGGVYLGGGIPPRILPALKHRRFLEAFRQKGRMSELLSAMPIHVIVNPKAALLGAACYGLEA
jgi:glucokinase